ncbi:MAG: hypothetical protein JSW02_04480, partial [candidate division WOR-3 bacterium]
MKHHRQKPQKKTAAVLLILLLLPVCILRADDAALFTKGNIHLEQGDYTAALASYMEFAKEKPAHRL